jgi:predicted CopG family antitoxin
MAATTITVSEETRKLLESLKTGGETYDDLIRGLLMAHPTRLTMSEIYRRVRDGDEGPIEDLISESRRRR